jgi:hypothetical protein
MAQKVFVEMVDDLDGSVTEDVTTIGFALDGRSYEIDLGSRNAEKLRDGLAEFIAAGRRQRAGRSGGRARGSSTPEPAARERAHAIREWAREAGHEVSVRGRISAAVVEAYEAAQQAPKKAVKRAAKKAADAVDAADAEESKPVKKSARRRSAKTAEAKVPSFSG